MARTSTSFGMGVAVTISAVAAFGQKLRGDALLDGFTYPQLVSLAGPQTDFWRQEFLQLVKTADGLE